MIFCLINQYYHSCIHSSLTPLNSTPTSRSSKLSSSRKVKCASSNLHHHLLPYLVKTGLPLWLLGFSADRLRTDMNRLLTLLFHQGVLDEQFLQLQQLQDETSPNFVSEVVTIYFRESEKLLRNLRELLSDREFSDYKKMGIHLNHFMGSSSSIGAKRVRNVCVAFRAASEQNNRIGCFRALELLEHEYCYLKNKLHEFLQIEQQRVMAAAVRYPAQT